MKRSVLDEIRFLDEAFVGPAMSSPALGGAYLPSFLGPKYHAKDPAYPFHTKTAEMVWKKAKPLIRKLGEVGPYDVMRTALDAVGSDLAELTPEDFQLLLMAIRDGQAAFFALKAANTVKIDSSESESPKT